MVDGSTGQNLISFSHRKKEETFMEQKETLGKRIAALRKEKGLTQEQLAEKVGVSAQAVSKWENDISCPDITLLPLLADLFDVSVDELLGVKPVEPHVIILDKDESPDDSKKGKGSFNWEWNKHNGQWSTIAFCIGAILVCLFFLLHSWAGMFPYSPIEKYPDIILNGWNYVWPLLVFTFGLISIRSSITMGVTMMALGGYEFVRRILIGYQVCKLPEIAWYVILLIFAIAWLLSIILNKSFFRRKRCCAERNGVYTEKGRHSKMEYTDDNNYLKADMHFGNSTIVYDRDLLVGGDIDSSFGDYTVDLTNVVTFAQNCLLKVDTSFGNITILLPRSVSMVKSSDTSFAAFSVSGDPDPNATQTIIIRADVNFGAVQVKYL